MLGLLRKLTGRDSAAERDAQRLYADVMQQSRSPGFYTGSRGLEDTQDNRLEILILHMSVVMDALASHGEQGRRLSQALFDTMRVDLDTALRSQGYSDSGVKRRIKPMIARFYGGLSAYSKALGHVDAATLNAEIAKDLDDAPPETIGALGTYARALRNELSERSLGQLASADIEYPAYGLSENR